MTFVNRLYPRVLDALSPMSQFWNWRYWRSFSPLLLQSVVGVIAGLATSITGLALDGCSLNLVSKLDWVLDFPYQRPTTSRVEVHLKGGYFGRPPMCRHQRAQRVGSYPVTIDVGVFGCPFPFDGVLYQSW